MNFSAPALRKVPWKDVFASLVVIVFSMALAWHWSGMAKMQGAPLLYDQDAIQYSYLISQSGQPGGLSDIRNTGAPFGTQNQDFPNCDWLNIIIARTLAPQGDFGDRFNRYYLFSFLLTALAGFAVARYIGLRLWWSVAVSLAFTLLPFHFGRIPHLFYTNYSAAAIAFAIAVAVTRPFSRNKRGLMRWLAVAAACAWCGATGVYYAVFSCTVLSAAGIAYMTKRSSWRAGLQPALAITLIVLTVAVQLLPSFALRQEFGKNKEVAARNFVDSEKYGLKIAQMLLPSQFSMSKTLVRVRADYDAKAPLVNENGTASLGMLGALGLLASFGLVVAMSVGESLPWPIRVAAMLVTLLTLVATIGGLSSIFSMEVTPLIRAWNRISPFIGFCSLVTIAGLCQSLSPLRAWTTVLAVAATALVIVDQWPRRIPGTDQLHAQVVDRYKSDRSFARTLVKSLPPGSKVLQIPIIPYPEAGSPFGDYGEFRDNLHAPELWWTHGAMRGRAEGNWLAALGGLPPAKLIEVARQVEFRAVVVDTQALSSPPVAAVDSALKALPGVRIVSSDDKRQVAYLFPTGGSSLEQARAIAVQGGWWPAEQGDGSLWNWSTGDAVMKLQASTSDKRCKFAATFSSLVDQKVSIESAEGKVLSSLALKAGVPHPISVEIPSEVKILRLDTDAPPARAGPNDPRMVSFQLSMSAPALCTYDP